MNGYRFFHGRERRYRLLRLTPEVLLNALFSPVRHELTVDWLTIEGMPEGAEVEGIVWDDHTRAFVLRLWHESFGIVEPSAPIPTLEPLLTRWTVRVPKAVLDNAFSNVVEES